MAMAFTIAAASAVTVMMPIAVAVAFSVLVVMTASVAASVTVLAVMVAASFVAEVVAVTTALLREELSVEAFSQLLLGSVTDTEDCACEIQGLACHRKVEIHGDIIALDLNHHALADFSGRIEHRNVLANLQERLTEFTVDDEYVLRNIYHLRLVIFAVSFLRKDGA